ncbi:unnamed protein product, partial [Rotaria sp. Silwood1]
MPTAANILTMLVWRCGLSIDAKISGLRRTIIPKARNLILTQTPPKSIVDSQREAGFCLETLLFGHKVESIGLPDGEYLLNAANWTVANVENF